MVTVFIYFSIDDFLVTIGRPMKKYAGLYGLISHFMERWSIKKMIKAHFCSI